MCTTEQQITSLYHEAIMEIEENLDRDVLLQGEEDCETLVEFYSKLHQLCVWAEINPDFFKSFLKGERLVNLNKALTVADPYVCPVTDDENFKSRCTEWMDLMALYFVTPHMHCD